MEKNLQLNSLTHGVSITTGSPSLLKLGDKQRRHFCRRELLPRRVKPMQEKREADGEKQWERSVPCKREDELLQHLIFCFLFGFFLVDSWRMMYDQFKMPKLMEIKPPLMCVRVAVMARHTVQSQLYFHQISMRINLCCVIGSNPLS